VDINYPSNAFILFFAAASFFGFALASVFAGGSALDSLAFGFRVFLSVFLAWAIGREIDPDQSLTAALAAVGQVVVVWLIDVPSLLLSFWALFTFRVLNRTTGLKAGYGDTILATAISAWVGYQLSWVIPAAAVFLADSFLKDPHRIHLVPGALLAGEAAFLLVPEPGIWTGFVNYPAKLGLVVGISVAFFFVIYLSRNVTSVGDETEEPLNARRVQVTQLICLSVAILFPLWAGVQSFHQSATFWSVLGASSLVNIASALVLGVS
jgi:hypothetical protein